MAAAKEVGVDAAIAAVLSQLGNIYSFKEEQKMELQAFLDGEDVFLLLLAGFGKRHEFDRHNVCPITYQLFCFGHNLPRKRLSMGCFPYELVEYVLWVCETFNLVCLINLEHLQKLFPTPVECT